MLGLITYRKTITLLFFFLILSPATGFTREEKPKPVKVEDLLTSQKKLIVETGLLYDTIHKSSGKAAIIPIDDVALYLGQDETYEELLRGSLTVKYGLLKRFEIFGFGSYVFDYLRTSVNGTTRYKSQELGLTGFGATLQVKGEGKLPAILLSGSTIAFEDTKFGDQVEKNRFKTVTGSLTSYFTVDPIVFFLQAAYVLNKEKKIGANTFNPGEVLSISPQILFVVNPDITIYGGYRWAMQRQDKVDNVNISLIRTQVSPLFGITYGMSEYLSITFDAQFKNEPTYTHNTVSMKLTTKLF